MPIRQQRVLDLISAFESAQGARADLQAIVSGTLDLFADGIITQDEFASQLRTAFATTRSQSIT